MATKNITLDKVMAQFGSEDACHEALAELRWPDGVQCPRCASKSISRIVKRRQFECDQCGYQFSVRVGTIFAESKLPLAKWFLAAYLMVQSKKGISANQMMRMLGVTYKTAWFLCHRIRQAMHDENAQPLKGIVEVDETFLGGKGKLDEGHYSKRMDIVMGAVERDGQVRLRAVPDRSAESIHDFIQEHVSTDAEAINTDAYKAYRGAASKLRVPHGRVNHTRKRWVNGKVHTNTIESVFSLLDRSIIGAYHKVSEKHLNRYLHEVEWRYNNRRNPYLFRDTMKELLDCKPMEYEKLTAEPDAAKSA